MNYYKNSDGYPDPTAGEAIDRVMREQQKGKKIRRRNSHDSRRIPEQTETHGEKDRTHDGEPAGA